MGSCFLLLYFHFFGFYWTTIMYYFLIVGSCVATTRLPIVGPCVVATRLFENIVFFFFLFHFFFQLGIQWVNDMKNGNMRGMNLWKYKWWLEVNEIILCGFSWHSSKPLINQRKSHYFTSRITLVRAYISMDGLMTIEVDEG